MDDLINRKAAIDAVSDCGICLQKIIYLPSAQPDIIRCKDCKWWGYDDDDGVVRMCHAAKHNHVSSHWNVFVCRTYKGDFYCADAERRTDEAD